jgi:hypothetical protein
VAIVILVAFIAYAAYATLKTFACNKGGLSSLSNFAFAKTPFKA